MSATKHVIVVGSGVAGLSAALSARQAGADVTIVERATRDEAGGNTRYTEAYLRMKSVDEPSDDFIAALTADFMGYPDPSLVIETLEPRDTWAAPVATLNIVDHDYVETLAAMAGPTLRWLETAGVRFEALPTAFPTVSTTRLMPVGGGLAIVEALTQACAAAGVSFLYETTARSLEVADGEVTGLTAVGPSGACSLRGSVVLACGGFEGSPDLQTRYYGEKALFCRPVARGGYYNKGEGIEMALAVGAQGSGNFGLFHSEPVDPRSGISEPAIFSFIYGILVDIHGKRFTDEAPGSVDAFYERITRKIHNLDRGLAWFVLDAEAAALPTISVGLRTDQPPVTGETLEELARRIEVPEGELRHTIDMFNAACGPGNFDPLRPDGLSTTGLEPAKSNWARPLVKGPFQAYPVIAANVFSYGGIRTDAQGRVLDSDGRTIPNLFAAGEMTGLYFTNYTGSTSVLRGAVFGRIGGAVAATS